MEGLSNRTQADSRPYGPVLVIDNGGGTIKAGVAGDLEPSVVMPTAMGRYYGGPPTPTAGKIYCGAAAFEHRSTHRVRYPIDGKIVNGFFDMEEIWAHLFANELKVAPEEYPVLCTYPAHSNKMCQEKLMQIMFETYRVRALHLADQAVLALYGAGLRSGVVVDAGATGTLVTPVYEGHALPYAARDAQISGRDVTDYLVRLLNERGQHKFSTSAERVLVEGE